MHTVGSQSQFSQVAHQHAHCLCLSLAVPSSAVGIEHVVPVIIIVCHGTLTPVYPLGSHLRPAVGIEHLCHRRDGTARIGRLAAGAAARGIVVIRIILAPLRTDERFYRCLRRFGINRRHADAVYLHLLHHPCISLQESFHRSRHIFSIQSSPVAISQYPAYPVITRHDNEAFTILVVEEVERWF